MRLSGIIVVLLAMLVSTASTNAGLVAWYQMNEPSSTVMQDGVVVHDSAGDANNATMAWDTPTSEKTSSFTGSSLNFAGDSMRVWTPSGMGIVPSFTWSLKIKTTDTTGGLINHADDRWDWKDHNQMLGMENGQIKFWMTGDGGNWFGTKATYNDGQWHTITLVAYYENLCLFIDGVKLTNDELNFPWGVGNNWFPSLAEAPDTYRYWIGAASIGAYVGEIKDVRFYNTKLSDREIALIAGRTDLYDPNLIVQYKMNDAVGSGQMADSSGSSFNAGIAWDPSASHVSHFTGSSYAFEQDSVRVFTPQNMPISTKKPFTFAVWVKTTVGGTLFNRCSNTDPWGWNNTDGYKQFSLTTSPQFTAGAGIPYFSATGGAVYPAMGTISVADGQWHHVAAAFDGEGTTSLYIDGQFDVAQGQPLQDINDNPAYIYMVGLGAGIRYIGEMADFRIYDKELTAAEISAMAKVGDFDGDRKVDANDLKIFTDEWLNNYTLTPFTSTALENGDFEAYGEASPAPLLTDYWEEFYFNTDTNSKIALLANAANAHGGSKAMTWDYNSVAASGATNKNYTEILYYFDNTLDLSQYDQMRVWIKRHAGNSEEDLLYVKFLEGTMVQGEVAESRLTKAEGSSFANPDQWSEWIIDLHSLRFIASGYNNLSQLQYIESFMFGVSSTEGAHGGLGTIDIDDITLVKLPVCTSSETDRDLNLDCVVNFADFTIFAQNWMLEY